jgi:peptidoglycan/LPS O-acetylase OafA/YrhL
MTGVLLLGRTGVVAIAFGVTAVALWCWTIFESGRSDQVTMVLDLASAEYRQGYVTRPVVVTAGSRILGVQIEAPVENSWLSLEVQCVRDDSSVARQIHSSISFYQGIQAGHKWQTGKRSATELVDLSPGEYRLRISGTAGGGSSSEPDFDQFAKPLHIRLWTEGRYRVAFLSACLASLLAGGFALRQFSVRVGDPGDLAVGERQTRRSERFVMLDGMRGLAALAVVFCHLLVPELSKFSVALSSSIPDVFSTLARHGDLGVEVFFVLSGFVIAYSVRERKVTPNFVARFAARRALRLDPPYYFALLFAIAIWAYYAPLGAGQVVAEMGGVRGVLANMFYLQDLLRYRTPLSIAWTLCLEVQFYLAYIGLLCMAQLLANWLDSRCGKPVDGTVKPSGMVLMLVFFPLAIWSVISWNVSLDRFDFLGTWFRFFLGVMVSWVFTGQLSRWWLWGCAVALVLWGFRTADARGLTAVATAVLIDTAGRLGVLSTWLAARPVQLLGRVSYSLYLVHIPIGIGIANFLWSLSDKSTLVAVGCAGMAVVGSVLAAWLIFKLVEEPSIHFSKRVAC